MVYGTSENINYNLICSENQPTLRIRSADYSDYADSFLDSQSSCQASAWVPALRTNRPKAMSSLVQRLVRFKSERNLRNLWIISSSGSRLKKRFREAGVSVVELSIALLLFTTVAIFGLQTIQSGWMLQNSAIMQSMTDAYAGIETANAQRWTFAGPNGIVLSGRWPVYPASSTTTVTIGKTPNGPVNATVIRTMRLPPPDPDPLTGAQSYLLESYVVYKDEVRPYC